MNGGSIMRGHPTLSNQLPALGIGAGFAVNQALANRTAWFIDPINGRNTNNGQTLATAIQTRSEFYRRMAGVTLTQNVTVTITSSLLAGDTFVSAIYIPFPLILAFVGVPVAAFTGAITAYTARSGATSQKTLMTIASLPVSWTASGLLNKVVEWTDGVGNFIRGIVTADLGGKQAEISPPISQGNLETPFVNGTTVNVWNLPNLGTSDNEFVMGRVDHTYLASTTFVLYAGRGDYVNCTGNFKSFGGVPNYYNCYSGSVIFASGAPQLTGGFYKLIGDSSGGIKIVTSVTVSNVTLEGTSFYSEESVAQGLPDVEVTTPVTEPCVFRPLGASRVVIGGFVYGSNASALFASLESTGNSLEFGHQPVVTGSQSISFVKAAKSELLSRLVGLQLGDYFGNKVYGASGPIIEVGRYEIVARERGIIAEVFDLRASLGSAGSISGSVYFSSVGLRAGDVINNLTIAILVGGAGTVMTRSRMGIYTPAGVLLAQTADQGASWQTAGMRTGALTAPFTVPTTGLYYLAAIAIGTTQPLMVSGLRSINVPNNAPIGAGIAPYQVQLAQADLPANAVFAATGTLGFQPWMAAS